MMFNLAETRKKQTLSFCRSITITNSVGAECFSVLNSETVKINQLNNFIFNAFSLWLSPILIFCFHAGKTMTITIISLSTLRRTRIGKSYPHPGTWGVDRTSPRVFDMLQYFEAISPSVENPLLFLTRQGIIYGWRHVKHNRHLWFYQELEIR